MDDTTAQPNTVGAPEGNQNALKFDTPEKRQEFCAAYCEHITQGYSDDSFNWKGSGIKVFNDYKTKYPIDFPSDILIQAQAERMKFWETIGINGTIGKPVMIKTPDGSVIKGGNFNALAWKFNMQNRFKWTDRTDVTTDGDKIETTVIYTPTKLPEGYGANNEDDTINKK